ncbi:MAG TPA: amino acid ABC transporter substrate-binding protein [Ktedonobacteraceae bacterium]|nr:amino acid ABC transporter substrate-binding protein [Ktedonobacteraceae bacterium]
MFKRHIIKGRAWLSIIFSIMMVLMGLSACNQSPTSGPALTSQNPITIGISISTKGDFASDGAATEQGYQLWVDAVNNNGGILGRPVKLVIINDNSDPTQVSKNYTTLITQDHVNLILGTFSSLLTNATIPVAAHYHYALLEGSGGAPSVFATAQQNHFDGLFDASVPVQNNLLAFAYYILSLPQSLRPKTAAYLTSDDPFTFPQIDTVRTLLQQGGVTTVYNKQYAEGTNNTQWAQQVVNSGANIDILGTLLPDLQTEIKVFKQDHYNPNAIIATAGPDAGQDFITAVGGTKYTEGVFVPNGWYPRANNFGNADMVQAYIAKYGGTADQINADVAEAYSAGQVLQQAIESIHSINNSQLIARLHSGAVFNTVQGTAQFDSGGVNVQAIAYMFQWQKSQFIPVYPLSVAAENPEYPRLANF